MGSVVLETDEAGRTVAAVNTRGVEWSVAYLAGSPLAVGRFRLNLPLWSTPKLEWFLRLALDAWEPADEDLVPFAPGGPKRFRGRLREPASYLACLVLHGKLFAKGVEAIPHGRPDMFYRCLLTLPAERMAAFLQEAAGQQGNAFFVGLLRDSGVEVAQVPDDVPLPFAALPAPAPGAAVAAPGEPGIAPLVVAPAGWARCHVDMGGHVQLQGLLRPLQPRRGGWQRCPAGLGGLPRSRVHPLPPVPRLEGPLVCGAVGLAFGGRRIRRQGGPLGLVAAGGSGG